MKHRFWSYIVPLLALVLIVILPRLLGGFHVALLNDIGIAALVVLGLVLVSGVGGVMSFGQAAFVGIAAYSSAWLTTTQGLSPWAGLALGLVLTCGSAWIVGGITMRLGGHYLALSTIAWGLAVPLVFANTPALGSHTGIDGIPAIQLGPWLLNQSQTIFILIWLLVLAGWWFANNLLGSRVGRTVRALRGGKVLMASFGSDAFRLRLMLFVLAAGYATVAGWLYAHTNRFVSHTPFSLHASVDYVFMMVLGGMSQLFSALLGPTLYIGMNNFLQDILPLFTNRGAQVNSLVFALLFLIVLQRLPGGIGRPLVSLWTRVRPPAKPGPLPEPAVKLSERSMPEKGKLILNVDNATKRFGGLVAVNGVSFELKAGDIVGLIGPNGAGKSTMFNLLTGTLPLSDGSVKFMDESLAGRSQREIALRGVARTFQHVKLRPRMSVLENVALGAHARGNAGMWRGGFALDKAEEVRIMAEAMKQIKRVGLEEHAYELAGSLPLGTQRLVEIARALAADPILVMLDEPAAGLRLFEKQALAQLLDNLRNEGVTVLIVEHDMEFVMNLVDRLVVMNFGSKIFEGVPAEVRANRQVQEAYLGSDA